MSLNMSDNKEVLETGESPKKEESKPVVAGLRSDTVKEKAGGIVGRIKANRWLWIGGGGAVIVLIALVATAMLMPGRKVETTEDNSIFRGLPDAIDAPVQTSGLSGRECEAADRRPIAVMLASDVVTRPVSGFAAADMVWELPVLVSDVTRLMAVYQCGRPDDIGSIRSARHDYLFLAEGIDAIMAHWGGSYHALNRINAGEFDTINALGNPYGTFFRRNNLPAPYNGFTSYGNLWNALEKLGYRTKTEFKGYKFKDDAPAEDRPAGGTLSIGWPGSFRVHYEYDSQRNRYQRYWGGVKQVNGGSGKEEVAPSAVVIMRATNQYAEGPGGYNDVGIEGKGEAVVYQDGGEFKGTWQKNELYKNDPVHFTDENGKEIEFTRGQIWVMAVELGITVTWEPISAELSPGVSEAPVSVQQ